MSDFLIEHTPSAYKYPLLMGGGHEPALLQRGKNIGAARLRDKARDFAMIRLAVPSPKVRTGGRRGTPRNCCEAVADTER
jgi:hypothetical protein